jgi:uncharacterized membrane protein
MLDLARCWLVLFIRRILSGEFMSQQTKSQGQPSSAQSGRATVNRALTGATAGAVVGGFAGVPGAVVGAVIGGVANVLADKMLSSTGK